MKFSLILGSVERTVELEKFFISLCKQTYKDYEVILVDQNEDERLQPIIDKYKSEMTIKHLNASRGLSRARNLGVKCASGDIIAFPDDDCWYGPSLLERVVDKFNSGKYDVITGCSEDGDENISAGRFSTKNTLVNLSNVWICAISITIFIKRHCVNEIGDFDEKLGAGAQTRYLSGEETDYIIRLIKENYRVHYFRDLIVYHPNPTVEFNERTFKRAYAYGCGCGYVLKKNRYPLSMKLYFLCRSLGGAMLAFLSGRFDLAKFRWNSFKGRLVGIINLVE